MPVRPTPHQRYGIACIFGTLPSSDFGVLTLGASSSCKPTVKAVIAAAVAAPTANVVRAVPAPKIGVNGAVKIGVKIGSKRTGLSCEEHAHKSTRTRWMICSDGALS